VLLFGLYLVIVIALPLALSAAIGLRSIPYGSACPNCSHDTFPLVSVPLRVTRAIVRGFSLQRRWCPACEWDGYAHAGVPTRSANTPVEPTPRRTQELRTLELGGRPWNVMLESWREEGRVYGRLLFVGPSGKLWCDPAAAFSAGTQREVLTQALSLSDRLLAYRLKEVISG
jgi:hypothetical protein